jgi:hypothetical protein
MAQNILDFNKSSVYTLACVIWTISSTDVKSIQFLQQCMFAQSLVDRLIWAIFISMKNALSILMKIPSSKVAKQKRFVVCRVVEVFRFMIHSYDFSREN